MRFFSRGLKQSIALLLFANLINIAFLIAQLAGFVVLRPLIVYEYFLIPVMILLRFPAFATWFFWLFILALDVLNNVSAIFLFNMPEFVKNLEFSFLYTFTLWQYILLFLFFAFVYINLLAIRRFSGIAFEQRKVFIICFLAFVPLSFLTDYLNGSYYRHIQQKIPITKLNIGGSAVNTSWISIRDLIATASRPRLIDTSVTYQTFANDTTGNQILILVESWGLPANDADWLEIKKIILHGASLTRWSPQFGKTAFQGSTTKAELRELLNMHGDYRYLIHKDSAASVESIFNIKKRQGYVTAATHSFSGKMFGRVSWWKNIGIDSVFFLEEIVKRRGLTPQALNYATPFTSVNDEEVYTFIANVHVRDKQKKFVYFLTENSHLPYNQPEPSHANSNAEIQAPSIEFNSNKLSNQANGQMRRILELISYFMHTPESDQWSKILIVGDHMPPFTESSDRDFYSDSEVPFVLLHKD
jgi:hypothetical protein